MRVLKFGGSSVRDGERIGAVTDIVLAARRSRPVAVVVSALGGVTDLLLDAAEGASRGDDVGELLQQVEQRHLEVIEGRVPGGDRIPVKRLVGEAMAELRDLLHGVRLLEECSPKTRDRISSYGELLSSQLIAASLRGAGLDAQACDARGLVRTDSGFGHATVDTATTYDQVRRHFEGLLGEDDPAPVQVITGFIASNRAGDTTTLGRSGSDLTAALFGAALGAETIEIWTDVDGVMSADPRLVPDAMSLERLSYEELMELSHFGAKVVFPPTVQPARSLGIPLLIKNTLKPEFPGTLVDAGPPDPAHDVLRPITGIASINDITVLRLEGEGMMGVPGTAARLFEALASEGISIILISQASSEHSICFAIDPAATDRAAEALETAFRLEIEAGVIRPLVIERDQCVVAVVGEGMRRRPGISGSLFGLLGRRGVNVRAIAQGSSELNISLVLDRRDEEPALQAIHDAFFRREDKTLDLVVIGVGGVGSELLRQLARRQAELEHDGGIGVRLCGVADSRHMLLERQGIPWPGGLEEAAALSSDGWREHLEAQGRPTSLDQVEDFLARLTGTRSLIDCTASEAVARLHPGLLQSGVSVITANKVGLSSELEIDPREVLDPRDPRGFYFEATVGAGLPVIRTLQGLIAHGDQPLAISGVFSGTLAYVVDQLRQGRRLSEAVTEADRLGYTEPDPRDDLSGLDVARKLLIMAREAGARIELDDVEVEPLYDPAFAELDREGFLERLPELDSNFADRIAEAADRGVVLAYLAALELDREGGLLEARVGLQEVSSDHPAAKASGTDNVFVFRTRHYEEHPLVLMGPGAGVEVTAGGLFADILRAHAETVRSAGPLPRLRPELRRARSQDSSSEPPAA